MARVGTLLLLFCIAMRPALAQDSESALNQRIQEERLELERLKQPSSIKTPPLINGLDDDGTLPAATPSHVPPKAAKRAAMKAEKFSLKGKHQETIEQYKNALSLDPSFYQAENNLALEYLDAGQIDLGLEHLRALVKSVPAHVFLANNLGSILCQLKQYGEAETVARDAIARHPQSYKANLILGQALVAQRKWTSEAKRSLQYASVTARKRKHFYQTGPFPTHSSQR